MGNAAGMRRRGPAGKARYREIEAAPEKMHWTALPAKTRTKFLENPISLQKHTPEPIGIFRIVSRVFLIAVDVERCQRFVRPRCVLHFSGDPQGLATHRGIQARDAVWLELEH